MSKLFTEARKALVSLVTLAGIALSLGLLHGTAQHVATLVIAAAGALGVYRVPNVPSQP